MMTHVIEAVYVDGVLRPESPLGLRENERVRVFVQPIPEGEADQEAALRRFIESVESSPLHLKGPLPTREELHDRGRD